MTIRWYSLDTDLRTVDDLIRAFVHSTRQARRLWRPRCLAYALGRVVHADLPPHATHHRRGVRVQPRQERAPPFGRWSPSARRAAKVAGPATTSHQAVL